MFDFFFFSLSLVEISFAGLNNKDCDTFQLKSRTKGSYYSRLVVYVKNIITYKAQHVPLLL